MSEQTIALVTGANKGIGYEIAVGLGAAGLNGFSGTGTPQQGAAIALRLAALPDDGPTGGLFDDNGAVPW